MEDIQAFGERVEQNLEKVIILIEDVRGVGKKMLARSLARSLATTASRRSTRPAWAGWSI